MIPEKENALWEQGASKTFSSTKSGFNCTTSGIESQFQQAMQSAGINYTGELIPDGKLHRFHIEGHRFSTKNGAYILHVDGCPTGWFMDYKTGTRQTWHKKGNSSSERLPDELMQQINQAKQQREAEIRQKHAAAAIKARSVWSLSIPITEQSEHAYLVRKHVQPHGARLYREVLLVIPIYDQSDAFVNLQFINSKGDKRFLTGGRKRGCFLTIGDLSQRILICEGYATGCTLFEESGQRVVIAFDAGNLLPVARNVRELSPDTEIIICGDNDLSGVGQTKAREAALSIGGKVLIPSEPGMDWNDILTGGCHE